MPIPPTLKKFLADREASKYFYLKFLVYGITTLIGVIALVMAVSNAAHP